MKPDTADNKRTRRVGVQAKVVLISLPLILLFSAGIAFSAYHLNYKNITARYSSLASESASMAATLVDGDMIAGWLQNGADQAYYDTAEKLTALKKSYGLKYLYVFVPYTDQNNAKYVFDVALSGEDTSTIYKLGDESGAADAYYSVLETYTAGKEVQSGKVTKSQFGSLVSAYTPLFSTAKPGQVVACVGTDIEISAALSGVFTDALQNGRHRRRRPAALCGHPLFYNGTKDLQAGQRAFRTDEKLRSRRRELNQRKPAEYPCKRGDRAADG